MLYSEGIALEQLINEPHELHHPLILAQIFTALKKVAVYFTVGPEDGGLAWPLLGCDYIEPRQETVDANLTARPRQEDR